MRKIFLISLAGAAGAIIRYLISFFVTSSTNAFPIATFSVNIVGAFVACFLIAGGFAYFSVSQQWQEVIRTGFLGSFTTFSAISVETIELIQQKQIVLACTYIGMSIIGGLLVGIAGSRLGERVVRT